MTRRSRRLLPALLPLAAASALALAACAGPAAAPSGDATGSADGPVVVVASTDVYGSLVSAVGGDAVEVTSIVSGTAQDPHSYEATTRDQLALSEADLVVMNGGGYDSFVDSLVGALPEPHPSVVVAVEAAGLVDDHAEDDHAEDDHAEDDDGHEGHDHGHIEGLNEHIWYDLEAMQAVAHEIAHALAEIDPANAEAFEANSEALEAELEGLHEQLEALVPAHEGQRAAVTELVPLAMLEDAGLVNATPEAFTEAIEEGTDVPPATLQETLALFAGPDPVVLLAYNTQTASAETERVLGAAESAGVAVVDFTETMPEDSTFVEWMTANVDALRSALGA